MERFHELVELVKKCRTNCPWCREQTVQTYTEQLMSEAKELEEAVTKGDSEGIREEIGDLFWDTVMLLHIAEEKGILSAGDTIAQVNEKIRRRKPYIETGRQVSIEEAVKIWNSEKTREKTRSSTRK
ncbi:hypothetical protein HY640_03555 [Candidatus Woesearchaeota archaeon]|nr:hypothetical protein [Candidatus Woesearchaeota archaeon]